MPSRMLELLEDRLCILWVHNSEVSKEKRLSFDNIPETLCSLVYSFVTKSCSLMTELPTIRRITYRICIVFLLLFGHGSNIYICHPRFVRVFLPGNRSRFWWEIKGSTWVSISIMCKGTHKRHNTKKTEKKKENECALLIVTFNGFHLLFYFMNNKMRGDEMRASAHWGQ